MGKHAKEACSFLPVKRRYNSSNDIRRVMQSANPHPHIYSLPPLFSVARGDARDSGAKAA